MQSFDFVTHDLAHWRAALHDAFGSLGEFPRRRPTGQLVKSLINSRTRDAVSLAVYQRLGRRWPRAEYLSKAAPATIEPVIVDVTFAGKKAEYLPAALRCIGRIRPDFRLDFLANWPVPDALAWLERLPGVGRKVAAATLNASTLRRPVFIVDSHVHRVLRRLGFIGCTASAAYASEQVTATGWGADTLHELFVHMKHLGQTTCRFDLPDCAACPLDASCAFAASTRKA